MRVKVRVLISRTFIDFLQSNRGENVIMADDLFTVNKNNFKTLLKMKRATRNGSDHATPITYKNHDFTATHKIWVAHDLDLFKKVSDLPLSSILIVVLRNAIDKVTDSMDLQNYTRYFEDGRLVLIAGGEATEQSKCLSEIIDIDSFSGWQPLVESCKIEDDIDYYRIFYRDLAAKINIKSLYRATQINTTYMFLRNALINAPLAHHYVSMSTVSQSQKNKPVLVVAAGPSLNKQLPTLKAYQHLFTILAVDTVWPILQNHGIEPDFLFALDSRSKPSWKTNELSHQCVFAVDIGCAPRLVWSHDKNYFFTSTNASVKKLLASLGVRLDILTTGGSVATSAFGFAKILGANPIILIGQDLALTGGKDHADGYLQTYTDSVLKNRSEGGFEVEGYYGDKVKTEKQLLFYKTWYEEKIAGDAQTLVINSTEGGAQIKGALQIPFEVVCQELNANNFIKSNGFQWRDNVFNAEFVESLKTELDLLMVKVENFLALARKGEDLINAKKVKPNDKLLKRIDSVNTEIMNFDEHARFAVDAFSQVKMHQIKYETSTGAAKKSLSGAVEKYLKIYQGVQESAYLCLAMLEQVKLHYMRLSEQGSFDSHVLQHVHFDA
jgi:hypothetical protein